MKIEKLNENQIKCTLTSEDLRERQISLGELAYGSEKAKALFRDMMLLAERDYGFVGEDVPIVVEAIPTSSSSLVMIITKVENPDELDMRFSRFTPGTDNNETEDEPQEMFSENMLENFEDAQNSIIGNVLKELKNIKANLEGSDEEKMEALKGMKRIKLPNVYRSFCFEGLEDAAEYAAMIDHEFHGKSDLYKERNAKRYYLVLFMGNLKAEVFNRVCNMGCEFGTVMRNQTVAYYKEYMKYMLAGDAVSRLAELKNR